MVEMARVIAVVNQKGGVGKTATVANVAWALVKAGHSCLAVDSDPQGSLTISFGFDPDTLDDSLYEGLVLPADHPRHRALDPWPVTLAGLRSHSRQPGSGSRGVGSRRAVTGLVYSWNENRHKLPCVRGMTAV